MGLDVYLVYNSTFFEKQSEKHKDHLFKIGYFRSSYNEGGFNNVMLNLLGKDYTLNGILRPSSTDGAAYVDWDTAHKRALRALYALKASILADDGLYTAHSIWLSLSESSKSSPGDAINKCRREVDRWENTTQKTSGYYNSDGEFYPQKPLEVYAIVSGVSAIGMSTLFLIEKLKQDDAEWYVQALEIVVETIEYVLAQPDKEDYTLEWSG